MQRVEAANVRRLQTPLPIWHCPSRRSATLYPMGNNISFVRRPFLCGTLSGSARTDYAVNGGEHLLAVPMGPDTLYHGDHGGYRFPDWTLSTGISFVRSRIGFAEITDGTSNTYLVGEKYVSRLSVASGAEFGDDQGPYASDGRDSIRYAAIGSFLLQPRKDQQGPDSFVDTFRFGSAHPDRFGAAFADGSVRWLSYNIDELAHRRLANRRDGQTVIPD